ncbi:hypothetical protein J8J27_34935, partial [Mycobacterium tuberculosis]|nr:hypothetical protein [Mycobacterium tuberculosis]
LEEKAMTVAVNADGGYLVPPELDREIGRRLAALGRPVLFVMEGGYAVEAIGVNAVGVLQGFRDA